MIIDAGCYGNDTKSKFEDAMEEWGVEYFAVWHQDGGKSPAGNNLNSALNNGGAGNPKHLIRPDKTFFKMDYNTWQKQVTDEGIKPHECNVHIKKSKIAQAGQPVSFIVLKNQITLTVQKSGIYSISLYSANGQLKASVLNKQLSVGNLSVSLDRTNLASGMYLIGIESTNYKTIQKVIIE